MLEGKKYPFGAGVGWGANELNCFGFIKYVPEITLVRCEVISSAFYSKVSLKCCFIVSTFRALIKVIH